MSFYKKKERGFEVYRYVRKGAVKAGKETYVAYAGTEDLAKMKVVAANVIWPIRPKAVKADRVVTSLSGPPVGD